MRTIRIYILLYQKKPFCSWDTHHLGTWIFEIILTSVSLFIHAEISMFTVQYIVQTKVQKDRFYLQL